MMVEFTIVNCKFLVYFCKMELKNRILEILEKSGLTPSEFADKIEVQRSAISHITSGRNKPSLEFLIKIKQAYPEIDSDWLIFGTEKKIELEENLTKKETDEKSDDSYPTLFELFDSDEKIEKDEAIKDFPPTENLKTPAVEPKKIKRALLFFEDGTFEDFVSGN